MASQNAINTASPLSAKVYIEADITATKTAANLASIIVQSDAETADKTKPGFGVKGHVLNAATRYPIKGYTVQALFVEPATQQGTESTTLLGSAVSALDGSYVLTWLDTPPVIQRLYLLSNNTESKFKLQVLSEASELQFISPSYSAAKPELDLSQLRGGFASKSNGFSIQKKRR